MSSLLDAALRYASLGWHVFPCQPGGKTPATSHGVKDATTNPDQIRAWWTANPSYNIAVACGKKSGIYVVDIDVAEQVNGFESLKGEFPRLPLTVTQNTPRGGAHAFYRTDVPPANKNSFRPGVDVRGDGYYVILAPSVHPNGGQYEWATGLSPWEHPLAEYPQFLRPTVRAPWEGAPSQAEFRPAVHATEDVIRRAIAYLATCDPAIKGQFGHGKLLWAAGAMVHGCGLSDAQAYDLLAREYNPRCIPPWNLADPKEEQDFRRKISEARKHPPDKPYLWILDDPAYAPVDLGGSRIDVDAILSNSVRTSDAKSADAGDPIVPPSMSRRLPDEFRRPTGFLGLYVSYCMEAAPYPNEPLALAGGLALLSAVTGRKIVGPSGLPTNIYILGLALPGAGKNFPRVLNSKILEAAGGVGLLADRIASAEGIEDRLAERPEILFQSDEVDSLIDAMEKGRDSRSLAIASLLNQLYTSSGGVYVRRVKAKAADDPGRPMAIIRPHTVLFGTATPRLYYESVGRRLLEGGFVARTTVFEADHRGKGRCQRPGPIPQQLIEEVRYWLKFVPPGAGDLCAIIPTLTTDPLTVSATTAGQQALAACQAAADDHYTVAERLGDAAAAAVWSRVYEQSEKLATLYALSDNYLAPQIDKPMVEWAEGVVTWSAKRSLALATEFGADSPFAESCKRLLQTVKDLGGRATRRDVQRKLNLPVKALNDFVATLSDQGKLLVIVKGDGPGRDQVVFEAVQEAD